jgi:hypothetical protein
MKRLRHPVRAIREPFGTAGLIVALVALVAALGGTALAAKGALTGKQKKEVEKIAKKYAGKPGAPGAAGPAGAAGTAGKNGTDGTNGTNGTDGKSVDVTEIPTGEPECAELGGAMVTPEGGTGVEVCNGEEGAEGSPWTAGGTLPSGRTETGTFAGVTEPLEGENLGKAAISFAIPLAAPLDEDHVVVVVETSTAPEKANCENPNHPGTASFANPEAKPGYLCVFAQHFLISGHVEISAPSLGEQPGADVSGAIAELRSTEPEDAAYGTWAVTAP